MIGTTTNNHDCYTNHQTARQIGEQDARDGEPCLPETLPCWCAECQAEYRAGYMGVYLGVTPCQD